jgi:hypothetical protein
MKPEKLVLHLTDAVKKIGYRVRTEEGNFRGGSCVFAEERLVILNRRMTQEERAEVLARVLTTESLDSIFLLPEVRAYIEKYIPSPENSSTPVVGEAESAPETEDVAPSESDSPPEASETPSS